MRLVCCAVARTCTAPSLCCVVAATMRIQARYFDPHTRTTKELGFGHRMKDIPVLTGNPRPVAREGGWVCKYKLSDRMEVVIPEILKQHGWSDDEVQRELTQLYYRRGGGTTSASLNAWTTVEEFQRTPWYRRFRPTDTNAALFISYEALKHLEEVLIPPSLRGDPYAHLRKRHMEDNWLNDRFSEESAKYVRKSDLDRQTRGSPSYGTVTRQQFMEFDTKFKKGHGGTLQKDESYNAWLNAIKDE